MGVDPLAEKYYGWSPYNYVLGNPILMIDPTGMSGEKADDWFKDTDGSIQYDPNVHSQKDLKDGQTYIGTSHVGTGASGKPVYYNEGGSIFFKSETTIPLS